MKSGVFVMEASKLKLVPIYNGIESLEDKLVEVVGLLGGTPLLHKAYFKGPRRVVKPIASFVKELLKALEG